MERYIAGLSNLMVLGLVAALLYYAYADSLEHALFAACSLIAATVPFWIARRYDLYIPAFVRFWGITLITTTLVLGGVEEFYDRYAWWDIMVHSFAGFGCAVIAYIVLAIIDHRRLEHTAPWMLTLCAVALSVAASTLWEIIEFTTDPFIPSVMQPDNTDTMIDLIGASIAAVAAGLIGFRASVHRRTDDLLTRTVRRGIDHNDDLAPTT
jgi:hypothetical protein